jgi:hypothetical protein
MESVGKDTPIFLQTDASNYGIGAYLFQIVDGVERPIAILSKGLSKTELNYDCFLNRFQVNFLNGILNFQYTTCRKAEKGNEQFAHGSYTAKFLDIGIFRLSKQNSLIIGVLKNHLLNIGISESLTKKGKSSTNLIVKESKWILGTEFALEGVQGGDLGSRLSWSEGGSGSEEGGDNDALHFDVMKITDGCF